MSINENNLVWLDLEMTGLNIQDRIIEIATIVTDNNLNILAEGPVFAIHQDLMIMNNMDEWNTKHHNQSGLVKRVLESKTDEKEAQTRTLEFLRKWVPENKSPICGNSVWQDRRFLVEYMPQLERFFHYRLLDVSTLKILAQRWYPGIKDGFKKDSTHRALQDIRDSIEELRYYRNALLK